MAFWTIKSGWSTVLQAPPHATIPNSKRDWTYAKEIESPSILVGFFIHCTRPAPTKQSKYLFVIGSSENKFILTSPTRLKNKPYRSKRLQLPRLTVFQQMPFLYPLRTFNPVQRQLLKERREDHTTEKYQCI
ncbi:uncharacterized protein LOC120352194 [Nilaparvata lugens]|uniref:uncharacterized protein LOC120352194 n=1 Tax=Nilaparvata lugens TaxID=108931 RepID=UPI00193CF58F|nr:uncharacterized protein LOC120352194 [Nilaparvata lugens]